MGTISELLEICPYGAWVPEDKAVEVLGLGSKAELESKIYAGSLPHVIVEHGASINAPAPFNSQTFFFVEPEGQTASSPRISLEAWIKICLGDPTDSSIAETINKYTGSSDAEEAFNILMSSGAIVTTLVPGEKTSGGSQNGTSGGVDHFEARADDSEIITRPDGTIVRRVKRATSAAVSGNSLVGFLAAGSTQAGHGRSLGTKSDAGDGEIYIRADGKKVRRVRKSTGSSSAVPASGDSPKKNLQGFLSNFDQSAKVRSASVAGDIIAVNKESSLTGEVYVRADGKKVRRVKKTLLSPGHEDDVEKLTLPDGTKVKRTIVAKSADVSNSSLSRLSSSEHGPPSASGLSTFIQGGSTDAPNAKFRGSQSVSGDPRLDGEIYVRADGKKVRRVRKVGSGSSSLSGVPEASTSLPPDVEVEIYTRPDGTKVRRIKKKVPPKAPPESAPEITASPSRSPLVSPKKELKTLEGFLGGKMMFRPKTGGSASVAGDRIAVSKDESLTGEVYIRADGKKVRRVKKAFTSSDDNVEIITRPDGTKVRRIRKTKPSDVSEDGNGLSGFLDSQPRNAPKGGAATVGGGMLRSTAQASEEDDVELTKEEKAKKNLDNFLSTMELRPQRQVGGSASVAGDMIAVNKESSLTGEVYVREDGKKVRRMKKSSTSSVQPGDEVEIITRPDGTKVRRIRRAKKPAEESDSVGSLQGFIGGPKSTNSGSGAASVTGDMLHSQDAHGEIYIRPDGKKVRRVRKTASSVSASNEQYEIYIRPDGTKVRRIRKVKAADGNGPESIPESSPVASQPPGAQWSNGSESLDKTASSLSTEEEDIATAYRKMLKMGMPDGAVMQKMAVDGVPQKIQDSVIARELPALSIAGPKVSSLGPEEEELAAGYRKMLKMGMPDGAVMQKMTVDGVAQNIQDSVLARETPSTGPPVSSVPVTQAKAIPVLSAEEEEVAARYRRMLKMGMPEGAVGQKMAVDGVAQNIQDSVLGNEVPVVSGVHDAVLRTSSAVPSGMALVAKDQATVGDAMVLVPQEQAERTIGMVAVRKDQVGGDAVPEGYVLVPKDQVRGDPGKDDLILVRRDQVKSDATVVLISEADATGLKRNGELGENDVAAIKGANIVDFDDLPSQVEMLKQNSDGRKQRFLVQALPDNPELEQDFIRKNLLPKGTSASFPEKASASKPKKAAEPSSSIAELLSQMSKMGGDFDAEKMGELLQKLESAEKRQKKLEKQLEQAGVAIAEDIDYDVCLKKVAEIGKRMGEIGGSDVTHPDKEEQNRLREEYFKLEQEMEKYNNALLMTDEYQA